MGGGAEFWSLELMIRHEPTDYLHLTLKEHDAARHSTSIEERLRHEELAIAYEMRCLLERPSSSLSSELRPPSVSIVKHKAAKRVPCSAPL